MKNYFIDFLSLETVTPLWKRKTTTGFSGKGRYHLRAEKGNAIFIFMLLFSLRLSAQTPFTCQDGVSYLLRDDNSQLFTVDLRTGGQTLLFNAATLGNQDLTGLGYNPVDNFLYASVSGTNDIVRIGTDGVVQLIDVPGLPVDTYEAGDFAPNGTFYLYSASATTMYRINVSTPVPSFTTLAVTGANTQDISITPDGQNILGISNGNGVLVNWPITGGTFTGTNVGQNGTALSAAAFIDQTGDLFLISAGSASVYEVPGPTFPVPGSLTRLTANLGTALTNIDGARCINSLATTSSPLSCAPNQAYLVVGDEGYVGTGCGGMNAHSVLTTYDISTGATTSSTQLLQDFNGPRTTINNLGYNPTDNYLWGFRFGTNQLVRIGTGNTVDFFAIEGLPDQCPAGTQFDVENNFFHAGDISADGVMYLLNGQNGTQLYRVDVNPASPNYLQLITPTLTMSLSPGAGTLSDVPDLAINPFDNLLYTVSANQNLIRIDGATGTVINLGPVTGLGALVPPNSYVSQFFDNAGNFYIQSSNSDDLYQIPNVAEGGLVGSLYDGTSANIGGAGDGARCALAAIGDVAISGNVFNDLNGNVIQDPSPEAGTEGGSSTLTAYLVDENGNVVSSSDIAADGSYSFPNAQESTSYTILLSNTADVEPGNPAPTISLPPGWINTGEAFGINNAAGTGTETATPGVIVVTTGVNDITGVNFGIEQIPETAVNLQQVQVNPGGTTSITVPPSAFTTSNVGANPNTGDPAPGAVTGIVITAFPTNATSITINGLLYTTLLDIIDDYPSGIPTDASGLPTVPISVDPVDGTVNVVIAIAAIDTAGRQDPTPGSITLPFAAPVLISGTAFNDANGLNGTPANTVDGTGIQTASSAPLFANLFTDTGVFVAAVPVNASGDYQFSVAPNTSYQVTISSVAASAGATPAGSVGLPANWDNTGENVGAGIGSDGTPDGILPVSVASVDVTNANFGVEQLPVADNHSYPGIPNTSFNSTPPVGFPDLTGYQSILMSSPAIGPLTGSDPEDCGTPSSCSTGSTFAVTTINPNTMLYYDFGLGNGGVQQVVPGTATATITNFDPGKLVIYGQVGSGDISDPLGFTYQLTDQAGFSSPAATYDVSTQAPMPVTLATFEVINESNAALVTWSTSEEVNSDYFDLQHSVDAKTWHQIGRVEATEDSKNSVRYSYVHASVASGQNFYRLKMVDKDGSFAYSSIRNLEVSLPQQLMVYPNPVKDLLTLKIEGLTSGNQVAGVTFINLSGKTVYSIQGPVPAGVDVTRLPAGAYILTITQKDGTVRNIKVTIVK